MRVRDVWSERRSVIRYPEFPPRTTSPWNKSIGLVTATTRSLEGYHNALLLVDKATRFRLVYGLKTTDETFNVIRRWWADISRIRARPPLRSLMRDNANENQSADLHKCCEEHCIATRYSTPYEQCQDGQPRSLSQYWGG